MKHELLEAAKEREKVAKLVRSRQDRFEKSLQMMMARSEGREVIFHLLADGHMWSSVSSNHTLQASALSARRDLVLKYYRLLRRLCPDLVMRMEQEHLQAFHINED